MTVLDRFQDLHVVVVGEAMLDSWLEGQAVKLSREAPVPTVQVAERRDVPGGAANTAVNVGALGARVSLVSVTGADDEGERLRQIMVDAGVDVDGVLRVPGRRTLALYRVVGNGQILVRFDEGSRDPLGESDQQRLVERLVAEVERADAVIVSDYGHGLLSPAVVDGLAARQDDSPRVLVVDSKTPAGFRRLRPTAVKPNWDEARALVGSGELDGTSERADGIAAEGDRILDLTGAHIAAVTLDTDGAIVFERGRPPHRTFAKAQGSSRSTGAGDTFVAALTLALAAGAHTPEAAELASAAAAVVVAKDRTATCSAEELRTHVSAGHKLLDLDDLLAQVTLHRNCGRRVVFTNGCFDILHRGHITYLNRAKNLGDVLVVGMNDDESVRRLKGPERPINPLEDRAAVLAALSCVDHIVAFSGESPADLMRALRPDVYAKGGDYTSDTLPEQPVVEEIGADLQFLPFMEDRSTTGIIDRMRRGRARSSAPH